jgi:hypothetical protein
VSLTRGERRDQADGIQGQAHELVLQANLAPHGPDELDLAG